MSDNQLEEIHREIRQTAHRMRRQIIDMGLAAKGSPLHFGGGLSIVEITATLYRAVLRHDPREPLWPERDRFILSKGHGVLGYYTALQQVGYLSEELLKNFENENSPLLGHPVMNKGLGIEFSTGSLGMGLSLGVGVALAGKRKSRGYRTFVLLGDGECNEGSVWEAAMSAAHLGLPLLTAVIDRNRQQQTGAGENIMNMRDLAAKWQSFGWQTIEVEGHDVPSLYRVLTGSPDAERPRAIIANTVKGKGISFMENNNDWHHAPLSQAHHAEAILELANAE